MGKKLTATLEEVENLQQLLEAKIAEVQKALEDKIKKASKDAQGELQGEVKTIEGTVRTISAGVDERFEAAAARQAELQEQALQASEAVESKLDAYKLVVDKAIGLAREDLERRIAEVDTATRNLFADELETLCTRLDQELTELRESSTARVRRAEGEAAEALQKRGDELDAALQAARQEARAAEAEVAGAAAERLSEAVEIQQADNLKLDRAIKKNQNDAWERSNQIEADFKKYVEETSTLTKENREHHVTSLQTSEEVRDLRFDAIDVEIVNLWISANDMENQTTRKVDWVIRDASKALRAPRLEDPSEKPQARSWLSPTFDLAGARGLVLELRIFPPPAEGSEEEQDEKGKKGDCVVLLHAPTQKGIGLCFRLSAGGANEVYENKWTDDHSFVSNRLCFYGEQINSLKDELRIGVEILECLYELDKRPPPVVYEDDPGKVDITDHLHLQRHMNNRIFDQVKREMDCFKSRNVRRVEWRLEEATEMRKSFPRGAPVVSKVFDAAGIEGFQFVFYPNGYDSSPEGFCGAYLSAPAGASLKSTLQVGKETRELNHIFEKAGYFGRNNFCRFESAMDEDEDTVLIVLDILEAQQDVVAVGSHPPPAAAGMRSLNRPPAKPLPIGSALKLQRTMDRLPPVLQEVKVLPSLWTKKNIMEPLVRMDGLKLMKDLRRSEKGGGRKSPLNGARSVPLLH